MKPTLMRKYNIKDKILFSYLGKKRVGVIESIGFKRNLKKNLIPLYYIEGLSKGISLEERLIHGKISENLFNLVTKRS